MYIELNQRRFVNTVLENLYKILLIFLELIKKTKNFKHYFMIYI